MKKLVKITIEVPGEEPKVLDGLKNALILARDDAEGGMYKALVGVADVKEYTHMMAALLYGEDRLSERFRMAVALAQMAGENTKKMFDRTEIREDKTIPLGPEQ